VKEDRTLELSGEQLRRLIDAATERILDYIESLPRQPSADNEGGAALARSLREPLPESGHPAEELLDLLFQTVIPKGFNTAGPGYLRPSDTGTSACDDGHTTRFARPDHWTTSISWAS